MSKSEQDIARLGASLLTMNQTLNRTDAYQWGYLEVMMCALAALVRSHPDPDAFAVAFRRAWQQHDVKLADDAPDPDMQDGIASMLAVLEGNCSVRLGVRPPGEAAEPEC